MTFPLIKLHRDLVLIAGLAVLLVFPACAHSPKEVAAGAPDAKPGRIYQAVASWYGPGFHGRRTASGEVFDQDKLTAAHRTYPFGTRLRLTNPQCGKSCTVVVNDRGPFIRGVDIDISRGASRAIRRLDTGPVIVEELGRDTGYVKEVKAGPVRAGGVYSVQVGSFSDLENASHLKESLLLDHDNVKVVPVKVRGVVYNRVRVGEFRKKSEAFEAARRLADEGYESVVTSE